MDLLIVPKSVLIVWVNYTPNAPEFICPICLPKPKNWDFMSLKKGFIRRLWSTDKYMVCVRGQFTGWKFSLSNNSAQKTVNWMATYSILQILSLQKLHKFPVNLLKPCKLHLIELGICQLTINSI